MKLFEFLALMSEEKFPIRIDYCEYSDCIEVEVNAFSEKWVVSFDENGFIEFVIYKDIDTSDNENPKLIKSLLNRPEQTWVDAANDLGIEFVFPYVFTGSNGEKYKITGLIPQFGGENGALITSRKDDEEACIEAGRLKGFQCSGLSPRYYDKYDRDHIIETLKGWSWNTDEKKPEWYNE